MKTRIIVLFITLAVVVSAVLSSCAIRIPDDGAVENTAGTGKEQTDSGSSLDLLLKARRSLSDSIWSLSSRKTVTRKRSPGS